MRPETSSKCVLNLYVTHSLIIPRNHTYSIASCSHTVHANIVIFAALLALVLTLSVMRFLIAQIIVLSMKSGQIHDKKECNNGFIWNMNMQYHIAE